MELSEMTGETIVAVATAPGEGGLAVIRVSGPDAVEVANRVWKGLPLSEVKSRTAVLGYIIGPDGEVLDQALATVFKAPRSFTGEDVVEFSCHGSRWIQREVVNQLIRNGARAAGHGEFSRRAFMNGRIDLAQAEGIADLISASSRAAHRLAMSQMKGDFSSGLDDLRNKLIDIASLLELELDFSEEDVEFADRRQLVSLADSVINMVDRLADSYSAGTAFKEGIPVVIAGKPNAGKSTLLNRLLGDEKAIVSDIPGTTRDVIEDTVELDGVLFRFFDTAGLRDTDDKVERIGIDRARDRISKASIILWMIDPTFKEGETSDETVSVDSVNMQIAEALDYKLLPHQTMVLLLNKTDLDYFKTIDLQKISEIYGLTPDCSPESSPSITEINEKSGEGMTSGESPISIMGISGKSGEGIASGESPISIMGISGKSGEGFEKLISKIVEISKRDYNPDQEIIVTNARHYKALIDSKDSLLRAREGIENNLSADFISQDIREATHHLGEITGAVTTDTLLQTIFSRFCIGK